ncbi:hypothetical protein Hs30E_19910 [Lactococcus hodotermopsidis]|uniref:LXG domain-containing protein n=1 Tax=Pseudolactococcus hodotermopsidis TaxID=2709157 RepID=A0A6A0BDB8_9LACT|nr:T7SS effector LXG polymorphic toxin [Lactococcus hodotermopsidis]GFH43440.1 hypothetical protein Hs30E_19910 [Lactococcus hodotermopsidis]
MTALVNLSQGFSRMVENTDLIQGQGADNMRAYISEAHLSLANSLLTAIQSFQTSVGVYWQGYQSEIDGDGNFKLISDEFNAHNIQLGTAINNMTSFHTRLQNISNSASHLVSLGGAGSLSLQVAMHDFEDMRKLVTEQKNKWSSYEQSNQAFDQVEEMIATVKSLLSEIGNISVGRNYSSGGFFNLKSFETLSNLYTQMSDYNEKNGKIAEEAWNAMFNGYISDETARLEREAMEKAKEEAKKEGLLGLFWDTLQIVGGATIAVAGGIFAPFSGGASLTLIALGGSLFVGGVNSAINHASMATRGEGFNLVGKISEGVGGWYSKNIAQPAKDSGNWWLEFSAGVGNAAGEMVSGMAQMNVVEITKGVGTLLTNPEAQKQALAGIGEWWHQLSSGNAYVAGETAFNVVSLFVGASEVQTAFTVARGGEATSILSKVGTFGKALAKEGIGNAKTLAKMPAKLLNDTKTVLKNVKTAVVSNAGDVKNILLGKTDDIVEVLKNTQAKVISKADEFRTVIRNVGDELFGGNTPVMLLREQMMVNQFLIRWVKIQMS